MIIWAWGCSSGATVKTRLYLDSSQQEKLNRGLITKPSSTPFKPNKILQNYLFQKFEIANF